MRRSDLPSSVNLSFEFNTVPDEKRHLPASSVSNRFRRLVYTTARSVQRWWANCGSVQSWGEYSQRAYTQKSVTAVYSEKKIKNMLMQIYQKNYSKFQERILPGKVWTSKSHTMSIASVRDEHTAPRIKYCICMTRIVFSSFVFYSLAVVLLQSLIIALSYTTVLYCHTIKNFHWQNKHKKCNIGHPQICMWMSWYFDTPQPRSTSCTNTDIRQTLGNCNNVKNNLSSYKEYKHYLSQQEILTCWF